MNLFRGMGFVEAPEQLSTKQLGGMGEGCMSRQLRGKYVLKY